jgi:heme-degrading monooxygenase HmoA
MHYHLAQINIARMRAPLNDPIMAGFVEQLDAVNALADSSSGFVWRLQTLEGDATSLHPYDDELILMNISVWASLADFSAFAYASSSQHHRVMQHRRQWFQRFDGPYTALWWVSDDHIPSVAEAKERLDYLRTHGESPYAFSFKKTFPMPEMVEGATIISKTG